MNKLLLLVSFFLSSLAFAQQTTTPNYNPAVTPNPGNTGVNAFEFIKYAEDPSIGENITVEMELSSASNALGEAQTAILKFDIPLVEFISVGGDIRVEKFKHTEEAMSQYGNIVDESGIEGGDLNLYAKIRLLEEKHNLPQLALRVTLKTPGGSFIENRRYTDTIGYEFSILAAKKLFENEDKLIKKVSALLDLAFVAWDTQIAQQNDAFKASAGLSFQTERLQIDLTGLYYQGWLLAEVDQYVGARVKAYYRLSNTIDLSGEYRKGFTPAAIDNYVGVGVRIKLGNGKKKRKKK